MTIREHVGRGAEVDVGDWWSRGTELRQAIMRHASAVVDAELARLERDCHRALALTWAERWTHLQIVYVDAPLDSTSIDWRGNGNEVTITTVRVPPAVACSWPDPVRA